MITGYFYCSEAQKLFVFVEGVFCPSFDFGGRGDVGEEHEGEDGGKGMGGALFGAGIGNFF